ncbi:hypothetical protein [Mycobacterium sp. ST-F2]|uniref:hypothetical protein n=1 Tax=Mycobacterium sp. ST-F2 TaxID=1490484 RepID=UPI001153222D|nr:hypothetical protein [Mycobacterium sp. ST-F2]
MGQSVDDDLAQVVASSETLSGGLQTVRTATSKALRAGVAAKRIDSALGQSQDRGMLRRLVFAGPSLRGGRETTTTAGRQALAECVEQAAMQFRGQVVDDSLEAARSQIRALLDVHIPWLLQVQKHIDTLTDELGAQLEITAHVPEGAIVHAFSDTENAWKELRRLAGGVLTTRDRTRLARRLASTGATPAEIGRVLGRWGSQYGRQSTLASWRRFTEPWVASKGVSARVPKLLDDANTLFTSFHDMTRTIGELIESADRGTVWLSSAPPGTPVIGRKRRTYTP